MTTPNSKFDHRTSIREFIDWALSHDDIVDRWVRHTESNPDEGNNHGQ